MIPTLHLPAIRCVQDVRTHVGDSQGRRRDACKTYIEVGFDWIAPLCSLIRVVMGSSHLVQISIVQALVQAVMSPWRSENRREETGEKVHPSVKHFPHLCTPGSGIGAVSMGSLMSDLPECGHEP